MPRQDGQSPRENERKDKGCKYPKKWELMVIRPAHDPIEQDESAAQENDLI